MRSNLANLAGERECAAEVKAPPHEILQPARAAPLDIGAMMYAERILVFVASSAHSKETFCRSSSSFVVHNEVRTKFVVSLLNPAGKHNSMLRLLTTATLVTLP
jgi:hypothetical protein